MPCGMASIASRSRFSASDAACNASESDGISPSLGTFAPDCSCSSPKYTPKSYPVEEDAMGNGLIFYSRNRVGGRNLQDFQNHSG
jgi:hypothetical protein